MVLLRRRIQSVLQVSHMSLPMLELLHIRFFSCKIPRVQGYAYMLLMYIQFHFRNQSSSFTFQMLFTFMVGLHHPHKEGHELLEHCCLIMRLIYLIRFLNSLRLAIRIYLPMVNMRAFARPRGLVYFGISFPVFAGFLLLCCLFQSVK